ncbi:hypothetical protein HY251_02690 [bacterium]|nr:hypothetical protein [bacterium]
MAQARIRLLDAAAAYEKLGLAEDAKRVLALASPEDARTAKPPKTP